MKTQQQPELTLITKKQVLKIIGFGKTKLFEMVRKDQFPQPIRFNQTCIRWRLSDVKQWIEEQAAKRS